MSRSWNPHLPTLPRRLDPRSVVVLLALLSLPLGLPLGATTLEPMTGEELTQNADRVVVAQCTEAQTRWHGRALVTELTFTVAETLEGVEVTELVVAVPGGVDLEKGIAVTFPGAPTIVPGENFLLFLHQLPNSDMLGIVGLSQGAFPIVYHEGKAWVSRSRSSRDGALGLDQVKRQIRSYRLDHDAQR